jgi:dihydroorotase
MHRFFAFTFLAFVGCLTLGAQTYDLLLKGGRLIDPKNGISAQRDLAITGGKVASVAEQIAPTEAKQTIDVSGLYVTPGFVDLHTHIVMGSGLKGTLPVEQNVYVDSHTLRSGVTTAVDAGTTGWRNFPDFKKKIIDFVSTKRGYVRTRVLALLNIVGHGEAGEKYEQDVNDMDAKATAAAARKYKDFVVGIKTAHYAGPEWVAVDRAVEAGKLADIPIMVDFGAFRPERPFEELVLDHLRPGDMYTHTYHGSVPMLDAKGKIRDYLAEARRRGVKFDVGHGAGSFWWRQAVPAVRQGFLPDSISTDLHVISMNAGMKNMTNVMSKFLNLGVSLEKVIEMSTIAPAMQIKRPELGHLSVGAPADIAVLRMEHGQFGFLDVKDARLDGTKRLRCELTLREGVVVWDLNGLAAEDWRKFYEQR